MLQRYQLNVFALNLNRSDGFDPDNVEPDQPVFNSVTTDVRSDIADLTPNISDVSANVTKPQGDSGFRVIMDEDKTLILVSGEDGHIYLVETSEQYDLSSPWGTVDANSSSVNLDVFGRMIGYYPGKFMRKVVNVGVFDLSEMPEKQRAAYVYTLRTTEHNANMHRPLGRW